MKALTVACASPLHVGDRLVSRFDAVERRIEFRRLTDQGREAVLLDRLVCKGCMRAELAQRRGTDRLDNTHLFEEGQG
jgi:hypothetical protein